MGFWLRSSSHACSTCSSVGAPGKVFHPRYQAGKWSPAPSCNMACRLHLDSALGWFPADSGVLRRAGQPELCQNRGALFRLVLLPPGCHFGRPYPSGANLQRPLASFLSGGAAGGSSADPPPQRRLDPASPGKEIGLHGRKLDTGQLLPAQFRNRECDPPRWSDSLAVWGIGSHVPRSTLTCQATHDQSESGPASPVG